MFKGIDWEIVAEEMGPQILPRPIKPPKSFSETVAGWAPHERELADAVVYMCFCLERTAQSTEGDIGDLPRYLIERLQPIADLPLWVETAASWVLFWSLRAYISGALDAQLGIGQEEEEKPSEDSGIRVLMSRDGREFCVESDQVDSERIRHLRGGLHAAGSDISEESLTFELPAGVPVVRLVRFTLESACARWALIEEEADGPTLSWYDGAPFPSNQGIVLNSAELK